MDSGKGVGGQFLEVGRTVAWIKGAITVKQKTTLWFQNMHFLDCTDDDNLAPSYGVYMSQLVRITSTQTWICNNISDFKLSW